MPNSSNGVAIVIPEAVFVSGAVGGNGGVSGVNGRELTIAIKEI